MTKEERQKQEEVDFKSLLDSFEKEDQSTRDRQIKQWRRLKLYWNGLQRVWWDEAAHDWRVWSREDDTDSNNYSDDYDKPVNVFRAYLESIIAALSVNIPAIACIPDDPTNPLDVSTAKAGEKIAQLIYKHNDAVLFWLHALYIYCTEGLIACYNYSHEDEKYGTYEEPKEVTTKEERFVCPQCEKPLPDDIFDNTQQQELSLEIEGQLSEEELTATTPVIPCPDCGGELDPSMPKQLADVVRIVGTTTKPKSRQCIEVYGGLFVKIPNYSRKQEDIPYLIWEYECHYTEILNKYPHLRDKIKGNPGETNEPYEKLGRLNPQYRGNYPIHTMTVRQCWFRPWTFNALNDEDGREELNKKYPKGVKFVFANELFCEAIPESLDDCWTLTNNPLSDYLHHDPLGLLLTSIQDITNDLISLTLQTIEHGIPQTFADPNVFDSVAYKNSEATPGAVYPTKSIPSNKNLSEAFLTLKTASLSNEVMPFGEAIQDFGQLVSGAFPSVFGGTAQSGSKTASEYSMSRAQALQRLQVHWKVLTTWWKNIFGKVIRQYILDMAEDERLVEKSGAGNYVNVIIRKAEVQGKIGSIELEPNENLPITLQQKKDVIMEIVKLGDPALLQALTAPENIIYVKEALGLDDLNIPGEDDRQQQYEEIQDLLVSEPIFSFDPITGMEIELPSIQIDPIVDNHIVGAEICRGWLVSETGREAKVYNPQGYKNVLLHMKQHMDQVAMQQMQQQAEMQAQSNNGSKNGNASKNNESSEKTTITKERKGPPVGEQGNKDENLPVR